MRSPRRCGSRRRRRPRRRLRPVSYNCSRRSRTTFLNSTFANSAKARAAAGGNPVVDLSPADAADRGIKDGEPVVLGNHRGELVAMARVTDDVRPGVASLPGKWWHEDAPANVLSPRAWSRGGQPAYNEIFV